MDDTHDNGCVCCAFGQRAFLSLGVDLLNSSMTVRFLLLLKLFPANQIFISKKDYGPIGFFWDTTSERLGLWSSPRLACGKAPRTARLKQQLKANTPCREPNGVVSVAGSEHVFGVQSSVASLLPEGTSNHLSTVCKDFELH